MGDDRRPPAVERLARRLRLEGLPGGVRLMEVRRDEPGLAWLVFQDCSGRKAWVGAAPAGSEPWAFNGRTIKLCHRPGEEDAPLRSLALARCGERLDGISLARLAGPPPKPKPPPQAPAMMPSGSRASADTPPARPGPRFQDSFHPALWREFCWFEAVAQAPGETFLGSREVGTGSCSLRYGDLECQGSHPFLNGVIQAPWTLSKDLVLSGRQWLVLIDDRDLIHGTGTRKVERLLRTIPRSCRGLQFFNCCIPMMTGDDVRGPVERFRRRTGLPVVFSDMSPLKCSQAGLTERIHQGLSSVRGRPAPSRTGLYHLAGFRRTRGRDELVALLARAGAELGVALLPEFDLDCLPGYDRAAAQALLPNRYYDDIYQALSGLGLPTLRDAAPSGWSGSLLWLRRLAALLGRRIPARLERVLEREASTLGPSWRRLVRQAAGFRAGFVLGPGDAVRLWDPSFNGGVHAPALVDEMGFGIDLLVYQESRRRSPDAELESARRMLSGLPGRARHAALPFTSRAGLLSRLGGGRLSLAYSNLRHDRRLSRCGIAGFSMRDFEMGLAGAVRTAERLLTRCRTPFWRDCERRP